MKCICEKTFLECVLHARKCFSFLTRFCRRSAICILSWFVTWIRLKNFCCSKILLIFNTMSSPAPTPHNWSIFCLSHNILCGLQETLKRTTWLYGGMAEQKKESTKNLQWNYFLRTKKVIHTLVYNEASTTLNTEPDVLHAVPDELLLSSLLFSEKIYSGWRIREVVRQWKRHAIKKEGRRALQKQKRKIIRDSFILLLVSCAPVLELIADWERKGESKSHFNILIWILLRTLSLFCPFPHCWISFARHQASLNAQRGWACTHFSQHHQHQYRAEHVESRRKRSTIKYDGKISSTQCVGCFIEDTGSSHSLARIIYVSLDNENVELFLCHHWQENVSEHSRDRIIIHEQLAPEKEEE